MVEPRGDARPPFINADEKTTLTTFLGYLRESVIAKIDGVSEPDARTAGVESGTSLLWVLKHLTTCERNWFGWTYAGEGEDPWPDLDTLDELDSVEGLITEYRAAIVDSHRFIADDDLDTVAARGQDEEKPTLRWILVHMIEETARHAGHADILRERVDGAVGR